MYEVEWFDTLNISTPSTSFVQITRSLVNARRTDCDERGRRRRGGRRDGLAQHGLDERLGLVRGWGEGGGLDEGRLFG